MDAASLDNLLSGDVVVPRRVLGVNGRVVATVGWEAGAKLQQSDNQTLS